jgi:CRISPR/Cas system-associated exonuclease Cas4 (RecB family)
MRPWSYSRLSCYEECPKQFWYRYVENVPSSRPSSPATERGSAIHKTAEEYLLDVHKVYPPELQKVAGHAMLLKSKGAKPEVKLAVKEDWTPTDYDSSDAYFRAIIDIHYVEGNVGHIQDWKTGKVYDSHKVQLETYVAIAAAHYPEATEFRSRCVYIDQGVVSTPTVTPADRIKPIRLLLDGRIKNAESDTVYPTRANPNCKWCGYSKRHGGPCPH